jgi:hypothetical protein
MIKLIAPGEIIAVSQAGFVLGADGAVAVKLVPSARGVIFGFAESVVLQVTLNFLPSVESN